MAFQLRKLNFIKSVRKYYSKIYKRYLFKKQLTIICYKSLIIAG